MNLLWSRIYDVLIKTLLSGENYVQNAMKKNGTHRTNCFEILGFDVLVDSDLKPCHVVALNSWCSNGCQC